MTNQTRDFDADDGRVLAEFAGLERHSHPAYGSAWKYGDEIIHAWYPYNKDTDWWHLKLLLDAVREKGLENKFMDELAWELGYGEDEFHTIDWVSAPPEAICSSILSLMGGE